jgi:hypothetical protein
MAGEIEIKPSDEERALFDDISHLASGLWEKSTVIEGLTIDPKMFSIMLFKRLWSNHRGFTNLWVDCFRLESDIVLRSALEAAICLSANLYLREEFVLLMKRDAAFTLQRQIKSHREAGDTEMIRGTEEALQPLLAGLRHGIKAAKLDWKTLAAIGKAPMLYNWHRMLSGVSSHVTGLSILTGIGGEGFDEKQEELKNLTRKMHLMMMAGTTLQGSMCHAGMIGAHKELEVALALTDRMNALSWKWPGVEVPRSL